MIELDRTSGQPLGEQIAERLATLIRRGDVLPGARLPSVRQLATRLGVSAFTAIAGYDRLCALHLVESRPGAGYFVVGPNLDAGEHAGGDRPLADPTSAVGFALHAFDASSADVRSGSGFMPAEWLADLVPASLVARVAKAHGTLLSPFPAQGSPGLRRQLSDRLRSMSIAAPPDRIVTTVGASQALDLILRSHARPGDAIFVEDPGYMFFTAQSRAMDLDAVPVPRQPDGPDLDAFEAALERRRPRLFITQTLLHNPTGGSTSAAKSHRLLMLAERHGFAIVEDDIHGEIAPPGATRLAQLDDGRRVYYVSSFSKLLSPALRVGFVALPAAAVDNVVGQKVMSVLGTPGLTEAIVEAVLVSGRWHRHVQQLRTKLATFRLRASAALRASGVELDAALAEGLFLWGRVPGMTDADAVVRKALAAGILLAQGRLFSPSGGFADHLRFNAAYSNDARLSRFLREVATTSPVDGGNVHALRPHRPANRAPRSPTS